MNFANDERIVMTLDAGGTNFVFSAIQANKQIVEEVKLPSNGDDLEKCLNNIVSGFAEVSNSLKVPPVAISFAFPGPADYPNGIIGDLNNLPGFKGGIALGAFLEEKFNLPVFINNDGDLYAYGEALSGFLPEVNHRLEAAGCPKRFKNLLGLTLGTGFGAGIVRDGELFIGDNSGAGEIWLLRNKINPDWNIEENASIRAVRRVYARHANIRFDEAPTPKEIHDIAKGELKGDKTAAITAFKTLAEAVGDAISNAITLIDGLVVIGGGLAGAADIFFPYLIDEMRSTFTKPDGTKFNRLAFNVYNLEDPDDLINFTKGDTRTIKVPGSAKSLTYDREARIGVGISKIGTSKAISLGAYAYALKNL